MKPNRRKHHYWAQRTLNSFKLGLIGEKGESVEIEAPLYKDMKVAVAQLERWIRHC